MVDMDMDMDMDMEFAARLRWGARRRSHLVLGNPTLVCGEGEQVRVPPQPRGGRGLERGERA